MDSSMQVALVGIGGTILGVILGWFLEKFSHLRKMLVSIKDYSFYIGKFSGHNMPEDSEISNANALKIELNITLFNQSDIYKIFSEPKIAFYNKHRFIKEFQITFSENDVRGIYHINSIPRQLKPYYCNDYLIQYQTQEIAELQKTNKVYLTYENGKKYFNKRKILLTKYTNLSELKSI